MLISKSSLNSGLIWLKRGKLIQIYMFVFNTTYFSRVLALFDIKAVRLIVLFGCLFFRLFYLTT